MDISQYRTRFPPKEHEEAVRMLFEGLGRQPPQTDLKKALNSTSHSKSNSNNNNNNNNSNSNNSHIHGHSKPAPMETKSSSSVDSASCTDLSDGDLANSSGGGADFVVQRSPSTRLSNQSRAPKLAKATARVVPTAAAAAKVPKMFSKATSTVSDSLSSGGGSLSNPTSNEQDDDEHNGNYEAIPSRTIAVQCDLKVSSVRKNQEILEPSNELASMQASSISSTRYGFYKLDPEVLEQRRQLHRSISSKNIAHLELPSSMSELSSNGAASGVAHQRNDDDDDKACDLGLQEFELEQVYKRRPSTTDTQRSSSNERSTNNLMGATQRRAQLRVGVDDMEHNKDDERRNRLESLRRRPKTALSYVSSTRLRDQHNGNESPSGSSPDWSNEESRRAARLMMRNRAMSHQALSRSHRTLSNEKVIRSASSSDCEAELERQQQPPPQPQQQHRPNGSDFNRTASRRFKADDNDNENNDPNLEPMELRSGRSTKKPASDEPSALFAAATNARQVRRSETSGHAASNGATRSVSRPMVNGGGRTEERVVSPLRASLVHLGGNESSRRPSNRLHTSDRHHETRSRDTHTLGSAQNLQSVTDEGVNVAQCSSDANCQFEYNQQPTAKFCSASSRPQKYVDTDEIGESRLPTRFSSMSLSRRPLMDRNGNTIAALRRHQKTGRHDDHSQSQTLTRPSALSRSDRTYSQQTLPTRQPPLEENGVKPFASRSAIRRPTGLGPQMVPGDSGTMPVRSTSMRQVNPRLVGVEGGHNDRGRYESQQQTTNVYTTPLVRGADGDDEFYVKFDRQSSARKHQSYEHELQAPNDQSDDSESPMTKTWANPSSRSLYQHQQRPQPVAANQHLSGQPTNQKTTNRKTSRSHSMRDINAPLSMETGGVGQSDHLMEENQQRSQMMSNRQPHHTSERFEEIYRAQQMSDDLEYQSSGSEASMGLDEAQGFVRAQQQHQHQQQLDFDSQQRLNEIGLPEAGLPMGSAATGRASEARSSYLGVSQPVAAPQTPAAGVHGSYRGPLAAYSSLGARPNAITGRAMSQQSLSRPTMPATSGRRLRRRGSSNGSGSDVGGSSISLVSRLHGGSRYESAHTRTPVVMYIPQAPLAGSAASRHNSVSDVSRSGLASGTISRKSSRSRLKSSSQDRKKSLSRNGSDSESSSMLRTLVRPRSSRLQQQHNGYGTSRRSTRLVGQLAGPMRGGHQVEISEGEDLDGVGQLATELDSYKFRRRYSVPKDAKINWFAKLKQRVTSKAS